MSFFKIKLINLISVKVCVLLLLLLLSIHGNIIKNYIIGYEPVARSQMDSKMVCQQTYPKLEMPNWIVKWYVNRHTPS